MSRLTIARISIGVGALLVLASGAYAAYALWSVDRSDRLVVSVPDAARADWFSPTVTAIGPDTSTTSGTRSPTTTTIPMRTPSFPLSLYPAQVMNPKYWAAPLWAGSGPFAGPSLNDGFERLETRGQGLKRGESSTATRIAIPAIEVDSEVRDLARVITEGRVSYEPVNNFVGRIPGTALPGEVGTGWYFGHLESPGRGEGNVFRRFPEIPDLIKQDPVEVLIYTDSAAFAYRVFETRIVRAEDLTILDSINSQVALVASYPTLVYTHRLVVFAELYARKFLGEE